MGFKLEIIGFTLEGCRIAQAAGAHRIELCDNAGDGGTTPSYGVIKAARQFLSIDLYTIIRPRGGDFLYSDEEFDMMKTDMLQCKQIGCDGVVTGILNADGTIDKKRCAELVRIAYPMSVTFHRAFDRVGNALQCMEDIIDLGFERILTSGLQPKAAAGTPLISALVKQAAGRIIIMPGSGIRSNNLETIARETGATEFHSSAGNLRQSKMDFVNQDMKEALTSVVPNADEVKTMAGIIKNMEQEYALYSR